jgi:predicted metal-binding protein
LREIPTVLRNGQRHIQGVLDELIQLACKLGASDAAAISTDKISVEEDLAKLCREPRCENYGLSASCPPHVPGPAAFREYQKKFQHAVVFKIDVPSEILLSSQGREIFQLLHEIAANIEQAAVKMGCSHSKGFAGGSCKTLFCQDHADCCVLAEGDACRHPQRARQSMSGFGINVSKLLQTAGWQMDRITRETNPDDVPMGSVSGLVLISSRLSGSGFNLAG